MVVDTNFQGVGGENSKMLSYVFHAYPVIVTLEFYLDGFVVVARILFRHLRCV